MIACGILYRQPKYAAISTASLHETARQFDEGRAVSQIRCITE